MRIAVYFVVRTHGHTGLDVVSCMIANYTPGARGLLRFALRLGQLLHGRLQRFHVSPRWRPADN